MPPDASDAFPAPGSKPPAAAGELPGTGKQPAKPLRPRHEAFCQYFVLGGNATYAARAAKYSPQSSGNQGYRLMRQPRIRARIAEIRRGLARAYAVDAEVLLGKLEALYQRANEDHQFHAAVRAVEAQARIAGHAGRPEPANPSTAEKASSAAPPRPATPVLAAAGGQEAGTGVTDRLGADQRARTGNKNQEAGRTVGPTENKNNDDK